MDRAKIIDYVSLKKHQTLFDLYRFVILNDIRKLV